MKEVYFQSLHFNSLAIISTDWTLNSLLCVRDETKGSTVGLYMTGGCVKFCGV